MDDTEIEGALRGFIVETILEGDDAGLDASTPLLEWGVIDSLAMVSLLDFIHRRFAVRIPDAEVLPRNFQTISAIGRLVKRAAQEPGDG